MLVAIPFFAAIIGFVWVYALTEDGGIFDWWPSVALKISKHPKWIKIAYECEKCISGQLALWSTLAYIIHQKDWYSFIYLPVIVSSAILLSMFIKKLLLDEI